MLGPSEKFEWVEFDTLKHEEFLPSEKLRQMFDAAASPNQTKSPKISKTSAKQKKAQQQSRSITLAETDLPVTPIRADGVNDKVKCFLEVSIYD